MIKDDNSQLEQNEREKLLAFEAIYSEIQENILELPKILDTMKAEGKEKTVRYRELFGQKLLNNYIVSLYMKHGIYFREK